MSDRNWKAFERRLARDVGRQRIPVTGERAGADFEDGMFCYQAKLGRRAPGYLRDWLAGIRVAGQARHPEKIGVVVWKPNHGQDVDAVVIMAWRDFVELHGGPAGEPGAYPGPERLVGRLGSREIEMAAFSGAPERRGKALEP